VSALFADIASKRPTRAWDLNPNPGAAQGMPPPPLVGTNANILHCNTCVVHLLHWWCSIGCIYAHDSGMHMVAVASRA
jgi:hypothetical protein